jgi:hypothetical protein
VTPGITAGDVLVLVWAMRGLVQVAGQAAPEPVVDLASG